MPLTRDDWIRGALSAIATGGIAAAAVEPLAVRLGATKGSFYWHFRNRDHLITEALLTWEREWTDELIIEYERIADPRQRLRESYRMLIQDEQEESATDVALLGSGGDPLAAPIVARVQQKRLEYLERCFVGLGLPGSDARQRARIAYSAYLGWFHQRATEGPASPRERAAYRRAVVDLLTAPRLTSATNERRGRLGGRER